MSSTASKLESLVKTTIDSAQGYERAAETAKSTALKNILREQSQKRSRLVSVLNQELVRIGGSAQERGSTAGALHHAWTRMVDAFTKGDESATKRVEEGEDYIEKKFREALKETDWDPQTRQVLERAHTEIAADEELSDRLEEQFD